MKILIFGKDGQLGKAFKTVLTTRMHEKHHIHYVGRSECDFLNVEAIAILLNQIKPDLILNAAAYTAVDKAETEIDLAFAINAKAPEILAQYAVSYGATLLHYSTDCVFDGTKDFIYAEDDLRNPLGIYGKSKAAGEEAIENTFANLSVHSHSELKIGRAQYAIIRASWMYGDGDNFIHTILRLAKERDELRIISDQHGVPTNSEWLASVSLGLVLDSGGRIQRFPSGIYHAVPLGKTTWHGFATTVVQSAIEAGAILKVKPIDIKPILSIDYPLPAPRPMNSRMGTNKLCTVFKAAGDKSKFEQLNQPWESLVNIYTKSLVGDGLTF
jgi:dTDP-4-dehydrorhamnose reductase